jgi:hypothetical protein
MSLTETPAAPPRTFSQVVESLGQGDDPKLTLDEVVDAFGDRGLGALILMLTLMALLPWPPGGKAVFAVPIIILSVELALQVNEVRLPRWALKASLSRVAYRRAIGKALGPIRYVENLTRPRLTVLTGAVPEILMGIACVVLAVIMALPVPFGDMLPGLAMMFFALGVMQKDGVAVLIGVFWSLVTAAYLILIWATVAEIIQRLAGWFAHLFG